MGSASTKPGGLVALGSALLADLARYAERVYPDECCGLLLGSDLGEMRVIEHFVPIDNQWSTDERGRRFLIRPHELAAIERDARQRGLEVIGIYHSHPDAPALPSAFDREHAWPWYSYLIASVDKGRFAGITGWRLRDDRSAYESLTIRLGLPHIWHRSRIGTKGMSVQNA